MFLKQWSSIVMGWLVCVLTQTPVRASFVQGPPIDVHSVEVRVELDYVAGVLAPQPFELVVHVEGSGITAATATTPNGTAVFLTYEPDDDEWHWRSPDHASIAALQASYGFGDFGISILGGTGVPQTASVTYSPGSVAPFPGFAGVTTPPHLTTGVPIDTPIQWACQGGPCGNFAWFMELHPLVEPGPSYETDILSPAATQWMPGCLAGSTTYELWIWSGAILSPGPQLKALLPSNDAFLYVPAFESANYIQFTTAGPPTPAAETVRLGSPPNPLALMPGASGGPIIGSTWKPFVLHLSFVPGALIDVLFLATQPANLLLPPFGTALLDPASIGLIVKAAPGTAFQLPFPSDCSLVGAAFSAQGFSTDLAASFGLTNALDATIGTH